MSIKLHSKQLGHLEKWTYTQLYRKTKIILLQNTFPVVEYLSYQVLI